MRAKSVILIGMMGCGKTTVSGLLAEVLGLARVDTDALIEAREGRAISRIFAQDGEAYFRARELEVCRELAGREGLVVACGGGLPLQAACMDALRPSGVVFWLDRDPAETYDALDTSGRPLAQGGREAFLARYAQREPVYRASADYRVERPASPDAAAQEIIRILRTREHWT